MKNVIWLVLSVVLLTACSQGVVKKSLRTPTYSQKPNHSAALVRHYHNQVLNQKGKSGFVLMGSGLDAFAARTALFRKAQNSIDVQYYLVRDDLTGHLFYESLKAAADRGVRVRILLDDYYLSGKTARLSALDQHPNIEIRIFNPFSRRAPRLLQYVFRLGKITRRMHNKSVTIDGAVTILGSRNIGNEYSEAESALVNSGMEVVGVGPIVKSVSKSFDQFWNYHRAVKVSNISRPDNRGEALRKQRFAVDPLAQRFKQILQTSPLMKQVNTGQLPFRWAKAVLIKDLPAKVDSIRSPRGQYLNSTDLKSYIQGAKKHILIITPYFIPGQEGLRFFRNLRKRGVAVSVLTNSYASTDVGIVNSHYNKYRKQLIEAGVELFEFKAAWGSVNLLQRARNLAVYPSKAGLHAKIITFDAKQLYIGSLNMDPRSIYENTEIGVLISSENMANQILTWFDKNLDELAYHVELENGRIVWRDYQKSVKTHRKEPDTALSQRLLMNLMSLIPIESQL